VSSGDGAVRRLAGRAWAFRARVEHEAARRFARLARDIRDFDAVSPVPEMMERAAGDEVRHAVLCAELADRYGEPVGDDGDDETVAPATLGARDAVLYEVVAACCITETESVATVTSLLAARAEPRVRDVLHEIARDEVTHSRMGWAHLAREAPRGVAFLDRWIPVMLAGTVPPDFFAAAGADPDADELLRHGLLPQTQKQEVFAETLRTVVFPGLEQDPHQDDPDVLWLTTIRSHDQFNTTIYTLDDRYRGVYGERRVLFLAREEMDRRKLAPNDLVDLTTVSTDDSVRVARGFRVVPYEMPSGACAAYYPETNGLVPLYSRDEQSGTPTSKSVPVRVSRASRPEAREPAVLQPDQARPPTLAPCRQRHDGRVHDQGPSPGPGR